MSSAGHAAIEHVTQQGHRQEPEGQPASPGLTGDEKVHRRQDRACSREAIAQREKVGDLKVADHRKMAFLHGLAATA
jgi:hypothetical protein